MWRVAIWKSLLLPRFAKIIHNFANHVNIFLRKIAKNSKTGFILANFAFFVNIFREKYEKK